MRTLALIAGVMFMFMAAYSGTKIWSNGVVYTPYQTSYYQASSEGLIIVPWEQNYLLEKKADLILWADVYKTQKGELLVRPWVDYGQKKETPPSESSQNASDSRPLLKSLLEQFPNARWVINCDDNVQDIQLLLSKVIEETQSQNRIILQSNYNPIMESLKETQPLLLYGSSIADLTRLKTFDSMGLLEAAPFKGDVIVTPLTYLKRATLNAEIVREMKRRFKKVILGPLKTLDEIQKAKDLGADGLFVADPFLILEK